MSRRTSPHAGRYQNRQNAALLSDQLRRSQLEQAPQTVARVEASEQGSDIRFIVTNRQAGQKCSMKRSIARAGAWRSHQGHEALHPLRPHLLPPLGGQSVLPVPSHGLTGSCTNSGALRRNAQSGAQRPSRPSAARSQDRCAHRRA